MSNCSLPKAYYLRLSSHCFWLSGLDVAYGLGYADVFPILDVLRLRLVSYLKDYGLPLVRCYVPAGIAGPRVFRALLACLLLWPSSSCCVVSRYVGSPLLTTLLPAEFQFGSLLCFTDNVNG